MKKMSDWVRQGTIVPTSLVATALVGFLAVMSFLMLPQSTDVVADMRLAPLSKTVRLGETFTVDVVVESHVPVNVFAGELVFDNTTLNVESISYNTSIADLWAEEPWYSNGDGTLTFAGGTTRKGGFVGTDALLQITFTTVKEGAGGLAIHDAQILQHDGLGTDAPLAEPIDALFTVESTASSSTANLLLKTSLPVTYAVVETPPSTDLNNDGKQSIADISILLLHMTGNDKRYDFNLDGSVNLVDLNILLGPR